MIQSFTWDRMSLGGPVFDIQKLTWLNGKYLHELDPDTYLKHLRSQLFSDDYLKAIIPLVRERVESLEQFIEWTHPFFAGDLNYEGRPIPSKGVDPAVASQFLVQILDRLETLEVWDAHSIHVALNEFVKSSGLKTKDVFMTLRVAVTGTLQSPDLSASMAVLGKEMVRRRLRLASDFLAAQSAPQSPST
jgi:glutamyl-tRNA synthetase